MIIGSYFFHSSTLRVHICPSGQARMGKKPPHHTTTPIAHVQKMSFYCSNQPPGTKPKHHLTQNAAGYGLGIPQSITSYKNLTPSPTTHQGKRARSQLNFQNLIFDSITQKSWICRDFTGPQGIRFLYYLGAPRANFLKRPQDM